MRGMVVLIILMNNWLKPQRNTNGQKWRDAWHNRDAAGFSNPGGLAVIW